MNSSRNIKRTTAQKYKNTQNTLCLEKKVLGAWKESA